MHINTQRVEWIFADSGVTDIKHKGLYYINSPLRKIVFDYIVSFLALPIALCITLMAGTAVYISDRHFPYFFNGAKIDDPLIKKHINFWKVRSMDYNLQKLPPTHFGYANILELKQSGKDPRITNLGHFLRKYNFDEWPQVICAAMGDISLIGPRIPYKTEREDILNNKDKEPYKRYYELINKGIKFGVTGMYVVAGRSKLSYKERMELDIRYFNEATFKSDLKILWLTFLELFNMH